MDLARWGFGDDAVVITGGGSGIGRSTAIACAALGLRVAVWDIVADSARATVEALGIAETRTHLAIADISDPAAVHTAIRQFI